MKSIAAAVALVVLAGVVLADDPTTCCLPHSMSLWALQLDVFNGGRTMFSANVNYGHDEQPSMAHFYVSEEFGDDFQVVVRADKGRAFVVTEDATCTIHQISGNMNPCINPEASYISTSNLGGAEVDNFYYMDQESAIEAWYSISAGEECKIANVFVGSEEFGSLQNTMYMDVTEKEFEMEEFDIPEPCLIPEMTVESADNAAGDKWVNLLNFA